MRQPSEIELIAYAEGEIENTNRQQEIEDFIDASEETRKWLQTYQALQEAGEEIDLRSKNTVAYQIPDFLKREMAGQREKFSWWQQMWHQPVLAIGGALALLIVVGVFIWQMSDEALFEINGVGYRAWGETELLENGKAVKMPPALQGAPTSEHLTSLTPELAAVLEQAEMTPHFWQKLADTLAREHIPVPADLTTLAVEDSILAEIRTSQAGFDRKVLVIFYRDKGVILIQWKP